jgi:hypothetical protein
VRTVVLEENGVTHDLGRALAHARLNNAYQRLGQHVVPIAAYPDMLQAYQQMDHWGGPLEPLSNRWSQGQLFVLPNMTFGQPPYHVNQMIARSYQPRGLVTSQSGSGHESIDCFAAANDIGDVVVVRCVNEAASTASLRVTITNAAVGPSSWAWSARQM